MTREELIVEIRDKSLLETSEPGVFTITEYNRAVVAAYNKGIEDSVKAICSEKPLVINVEKKLNSLKIRD